MSNYFGLTDQDFADMKAAVGGLISVISKECKLYYPGIMEECVNCIYDPIGHKSSNRFRTGGPMPFGNGFPCPVCNGTGQRTKEVTETLSFAVNWNLNDNYGNNSYIMVGNIRLPAGTILIRGPLENLPKVQACDYMIVQSNIQNINRYKFRLESEPFDPGNWVPNAFFAAVLKRIG